MRKTVTNTRGTGFCRDGIIAKPSEMGGYNRVMDILLD